MTGQLREFGPFSAAAVTDGGGTETSILTVGPVNTDDAADVVTISGFLEITTNATAASAVVVRVRRTSATGTQVGTTETITATTSTKYDVAFSVKDSPGDVAGLNYVVTVAETGGGANTGTVDVISAFALVT